jgi:hypothetical protein
MLVKRLHVINACAGSLQAHMKGDVGIALDDHILSSEAIGDDVVATCRAILHKQAEGGGKGLMV